MFIPLLKFLNDKCRCTIASTAHTHELRLTNESAGKVYLVSIYFLKFNSSKSKEICLSASPKAYNLTHFFTTVEHNKNKTKMRNFTVTKIINNYQVRRI